MHPDDPPVTACQFCNGDLRDHGNGAAESYAWQAALAEHKRHEATGASGARRKYHIPTNERYFLDADGFCWREVEMDGDVWHSMARINPDNSATPGPLEYLTPVTQEQHTLRAYRLALMDASAIFAQTAAQHEKNSVDRHTYAEGARVLRQWASDPGRMLGPLHRLRADDTSASGDSGSSS